MKCKFIIGADFVPTNVNEDLFINGDVANLFGDRLKSILDEVDFRIFNLEVPITDNKSPIDKQGPNLIANSQTINGYIAAGTDVLSLANNHILDQGVQGLDSTIEILKKYNIGYLGAGSTYEEAAKPYFFEFANKKIGLYACTEHEFTIVTERHGGANPFDALESFDHIIDIKSMCDYVVVLYHGGREHYRYPSPDVQRICRKFVEKGADLVVCQHSHCVGCEEKYQNGTIVYGQGNFLFNNCNNEFWNTSLLICVDENFEISYIPLERTEQGVCLANEVTANNIMGGFKRRTEEIKENNFVKKKYAETAEKTLGYYLMSLYGKKHGMILRALNKISGYRFYDWYMSIKYNKYKLLTIKNFVECEAHRELLLSGIDSKVK